MWGERVGTHITPKNPSSEICGEVAAAMAASAVAFRQTDPAYADTLVDHAKQMYEFGRKHPGSYMDSQLPGLKDSAKHYPSSGWHDEMAWGALWLHFATGVSHPVWRRRRLLMYPYSPGIRCWHVAVFLFTLLCKRLCLSYGNELCP